MLVAAPSDKPTIKSPADAANLLMLEMGAYEQEHLIALILDSKNHVLKVHTVYIGSLNTAVVRVGELFREAIRMNAAAVHVGAQSSQWGSNPIGRGCVCHPADGRGGQAVEHRRARSLDYMSS